MKLKVKYATNERNHIRPGMYQNVSKEAELEPVRILRQPCGTGAAANRYYYKADFIAPDNAEFVFNGMIRENVNRKLNPRFNPKKLNWVGNIASI